MHQSQEHIHRLKEFAHLIAPTVYKVVRAREASYRLLKFITGNEGQHCRAVVFSIDDDTLHKYGIMRAGAFIPTRRDGNVSHAYFAIEDDPSLVLDFCASFLALGMGTSVNAWRRSNPKLFYNKALLGAKNDIAHHFEVQYPRRNVDFWNHFHSGQ